MANKVDLITIGSATGPSGKPLTKAEVGMNRIRTILEREMTKRANDLKRSVGIEGLGSEENKGKPASGPDAGVIDSSSGLTGLECSNNSMEGFKFAAWEYGEIELVSSSVSVMDGEFGDVGQLEKLETADEHEGLNDLKDWLNENLS